MTLARQQFRLQVETRRRLLARRPRVRPMPRQRHPLAVEASYTAFLLSLLEAAERLVREEVVPMLPRLVAETRSESARADAPADDVVRVFRGLRVAVGGVTTDERLEPRVGEVGRATSAWAGRELQRQVTARLGVETPLRDPQIGSQMRSWTAENVALIKSIPGDMLDEVERLVLSGVNRGQRAEDMAEAIRERFGVAENRAALIARDQVGKFYGTAARARQQAIGVTRYRWRATPDERTREEHVVRDGEIFEWSDPPADGHPGQPIDCRCTADPVLEDLLDDAA